MSGVTVWCTYYKIILKHQNDQQWFLHSLSCQTFISKNNSFYIDSQFPTIFFIIKVMCIPFSWNSIPRAPCSILNAQSTLKASQNIPWPIKTRATILKWSCSSDCLITMGVCCAWRKLDLPLWFQRSVLASARKMEGKVQGIRVLTRLISFTAGPLRYSELYFRKPTVVLNPHCWFKCARPIFLFGILAPPFAHNMGGIL